MYVEDGMFHTGVDELVRNFQSALVGVVPAADRISFVWSDVMDQSPQWEKLQCCLFDVFVRHSISLDRERSSHEFPLAAYDIDLDHYGKASWLSFTRASGSELALVRLITRDAPFDTAEGVEVDPVTFARGERFEVPLEDTTFAYVRRTPDSSVRLDRVVAVE